MSLNIKRTSTVLMLAVFSLATPFLAVAAPGHDHGEESAPAATGAALARFAAVSEAFELVGVVNGKQVTLYLDRFADNSPVKNAQLELEIGGTVVKAVPHGEGEFEARLAEELKPGDINVIATVIAEGETDLLVATFDLHTSIEANDEARTHVHGWQEYAGLAGGGLLLLAVLGWVVRGLIAKRNWRIGGVA